MEPTIVCDGCGYDRRGLPADARCPECGEGPPAMAGGGSVGGEPPRTANEVAWARRVAAGLVVLLVTSYYALQVTVLMPVGSFSVSGVNFAGPKVQGVSLTQRELNGRPGELGVNGMVASLVGVAGVWLLTTGQRLGTAVGGEGDVPGRRTRAAARWAAVVAVGGITGGVLDYNGGYLNGMSNAGGAVLLAAVAGCELPANLLLYLHLRHLGRRLGCRRAARPLAACAWLVPTVIGLGGVLQAAQMRWHEPTWRGYGAPPSSDDWVWTVASAAYGAVALGTAAAATAAVLSLTGTAAAIGFGGGAARLVGGGADAVVAAARRAAAAVDRALPRWAAVAGLVGWVLLLPFHAAGELRSDNRAGLLGNVPLVNVVGPVVAVPRMAEDRRAEASAFDAGDGWLCVASLAAVWLVTGLRASDRRDDVATAARWWATLAVTAPAGVLLGMTAYPHVVNRRSWEVAAVVTFGQAPATFLLYLHLASLATSVRATALARRFRVLAWALPAVAGLPLLGLVFSRPAWHNYQSPTLTAVAAAELVVAVCLSFVAGAAVLLLARELARDGGSAERHTVPGEGAGRDMPAEAGTPG